MERQRKAYVVYVDLDPMPGAMHTQESGQNIISSVLSDRIGHYNPIVSLAPSYLQPENLSKGITAA